MIFPDDEQLPPPHPNCRCVLPQETPPVPGWVRDRRPSPILENVFRELDRSALRALAEVACEHRKEEGD